MFDDLIFKVANAEERVLALALRKVVFEDEQRPAGLDLLDETSDHQPLRHGNIRGQGYFH